MKVYYFTVIAVGIMFLLFLGGVETNSSQIITAVGGNNPSGYQGTTLWAALAVAVAAFIATTTRISAGVISFQASRESIIATFLAAFWGIFASDMFSILSKIGSLTCPAAGTITSCGWTYWIAWILIVPATIGYGISIIQFIMGAD